MSLPGHPTPGLGPHGVRRIGLAAVIGVVALASAEPTAATATATSRRVATARTLVPAAKTPAPATQTPAPVARAAAGTFTDANPAATSPPTVSISTPVQNAKYTYGEKVKANYTCTAPVGAALSACLGSDDLGDTVNSGDDIDTTHPGVHTLDVQALDTDGSAADAEVTYTVAPDNRVAITTAKTAKNGLVKLTLTVPGAGTLKLSETHGATTFAAKTERLGRAYVVLPVTLLPTPAGKRLLKAGRPIRITLALTFTPRGGSRHTFTRVLTVP
jgi:hypothetical protein